MNVSGRGAVLSISDWLSEKAFSAAVVHKQNLETLPTHKPKGL